MWYTGVTYKTAQVNAIMYKLSFKNDIKVKYFAQWLRAS